MRQSFLIFAAGLLALVACQREVMDPQTESKPEAELSNATTVEVIAGEAGTRTEISQDGSSFALSWSQGDQVDLAEIIYEFFPGGGENEPWPTVIYTSNSLSQATETATFSVDMGPRYVPENAKYHYVGVYPTGHIYGATQYGNHARMSLYFPDSQSPSATTFDPQADLLVSEIKNTSSRMSGSVQMKFARVGTIVKMTLKGLIPGAQVTSGTFTTDPNDWASDYLVTYDPDTKELEYSKSEGVLNFYPQDVFVNENGEADIWLRTRSGTISSWFRVDITTSLDKVETQYVKIVDLQSSKRTITLKNGGLTSFGVTMEPKYNIRFDYSDEIYDVTETGFKFQGWCYFNDVPTEVVNDAEYGIVLLTEDPPSNPKLSDFPAESILPFDPVYPYPGSNNYTFLRGIMHLTGLSPATRYYVLPYLKLGSAAYFRNAPLSTKTLTVYAAPELVDLGLPSGTLWADRNLGGSEPGAAGDYFMFGSTEPMGDYYYGGNSYWGSVWNSYLNRYIYKASKYLTDERYKYDPNETYYFEGMDCPVDYQVELEYSDDAASVKLGEGWRTPTYYDFLELQQYCAMTENNDGSVTWTAENGNSITLPACGYYQGSADKKTDASYYLTGSLCVEGVTNYNHNTLFRNQIWVFWKGFPNINTQNYLDNSGYRSGYYNIRPVYSDEESMENRKYYWGYVWPNTPIVTSNSATLSAYFWGLDENVNYKYWIQYFDSNGSYLNTKQLNGPDDYGNYKATFNNLSPGTVYYYQAYATHPGNSTLSQYSSIEKFTTSSN